MVVIDMMNVSAFEVVDELKLPVVANLPMPIDLLKMMGHNFPNHDNVSSCCGLICIRQTIFQYLM